MDILTFHKPHGCARKCRKRESNDEL